MIRRIVLLILLGLILASCNRSITTRRASESLTPTALQSLGPTAQALAPTAQSLAATSEALIGSAEGTDQAAAALAVPESKTAPQAAAPGVPEAMAVPQDAPLAADAQRMAGLPRFAVQAGTPLAIENFIYPELGCNWMGVGGQVFDRSGTPLSNLVIEVAGTLGGLQVIQLALTGSAPQLGSGGFVARLSDRGMASQDSLYLRVLDLSGNQLSAPIYFDTFTGCQQNLILVNLAELAVANNFFLPYLPNQPTVEHSIPLVPDQNLP